MYDQLSKSLVSNLTGQTAKACPPVYVCYLMIEDASLVVKDRCLCSSFDCFSPQLFGVFNLDFAAWWEANCADHESVPSFPGGGGGGVVAAKPRFLQGFEQGFRGST